jgi:hypothetical protein
MANSRYRASLRAFPEKLNQSPFCQSALLQHLLDSHHLFSLTVKKGHFMSTHEIDSIAALPIATDSTWITEINSFWVATDSEELNDLQRDGATAVIDLAAEFEVGKGLENSDLRARVIGRMSDIQVRDFALGSHNEESAQWYWVMWRELLVSAPPGFVAPIASVFAALAYERGDGELAHKALDRALADDSRYSLAILLRRVFSAGWPAQSFTVMRRDLHPKVVTVIFG